MYERHSLECPSDVVESGDFLFPEPCKSKHARPSAEPGAASLYLEILPYTFDCGFA